VLAEGGGFLMGPRQATSEEKRQLAVLRSAALEGCIDSSIDTALKDVQNSSLAVFDGGILDNWLPGMGAKAMIVLWFGCPEFSEVYVWRHNAVQKFVPYT
jgi:hypothetical protein